MSVEHLVGVIIIVLAYFTFCALVFYSNRIVEKIHKSNAGTPRQIKRVLSSRENDDGGSQTHVKKLIRCHYGSMSLHQSFHILSRLKHGLTNGQARFSSLPRAIQFSDKQMLVVHCISLYQVCSQPQNEVTWHLTKGKTTPFHSARTNGRLRLTVPDYQQCFPPYFTDLQIANLLQ